MAKREENNFKKAMNGLLGYGEKEEQQVQGEVVVEKTAPVTPEILMPRKEPELPVAREEAVIPSDMVINGNITTKSNMRILGSVVGDVNCDGSIWLMGSSEGKILAEKAVELRENAYVHGDITAGALSVSTGAKIKGLVDVSE